MHALRLLNIGALCLASSLAIASCSSSSDPTTRGETGGLLLELEVGDGIQIDRVAWTITGEDMPAMSGDVNTSAPGSTASVEVFGLPEGDFIITLEATATDGETTCSGSAPFSIEAGEVHETYVILRCKLPPNVGGVRVNGKFNICAELTKGAVSPLQTSVGNVINLMADAVDAENDPIDYRWTALVGTIADPSDPITIYTCTEPGNDEITITVSDDGFDYCTSGRTVPVTCMADGGGTGGSAGSGGMAGAGGSAGSGGMAGAGGSAGSGGMAGAGGQGGTAGSGGEGGSAGSGGMAGVGGEGGSAGAGGVGGDGGMAGSGGDGGTGGEGCDCRCFCKCKCKHRCKPHPVWDRHPGYKHPPGTRHDDWPRPPGHYGHDDWDDDSDSDSGDWDDDDDSDDDDSDHGDWDDDNDCDDRCDCDKVCDRDDCKDECDCRGRRWWHIHRDKHPHKSWKHWYDFWKRFWHD